MGVCGREELTKRGEQTFGGDGYVPASIVLVALWLYTLKLIPLYSLNILFIASQIYFNKVKNVLLQNLVLSSVTAMELSRSPGFQWERNFWRAVAVLTEPSFPSVIRWWDWEPLAAPCSALPRVNRAG